jgi:hypothetical protein
MSSSQRRDELMPQAADSPEVQIEPPPPADEVEPGVGSPDVQVLVQTIKELAATNARYEALFAEQAATIERNERLLAEHAAPPIIWLTLKNAGYRAGGLSSECMRKWTMLDWVESRREGDLIVINKASLDARLARLGRHPR